MPVVAFTLRINCTALSPEDYQEISNKFRAILLSAAFSELLPDGYELTPTSARLNFELRPTARMKLE